MPESTRLRREIGLGGAVVTGLGSILGTGVFVSIALAAENAGRWVMLAAPLAALVAIGNGLSSAQLAAAHPVAGGTYEYGYRYLGAWPGYLAGCLFLTAKSASAATAALGFAAYLLAFTGGGGDLRTPVAIVAVGAVTGLVVAGLRRTATANAVLVVVTIGSLLVFLAAGVIELGGGGLDPARFDRGLSSVTWWQVLPEATALMFVAYTGYGRIATLGEEVREPSRTIPRAVIVTLAISATLYTAVAVVGWRVGGTDWRTVNPDGSTIGAPLAALVDGPVAAVVELGAMAAMFGVLVNLVLGLSRVWLAMGRRRDLPHRLADLDRHDNPTLAVIVSGVVVAAIALVGDLRLAWSFSAFTVLLYYAITNAAALRLDDSERSFPRAVSVFGLLSCGFLSIWVDPTALVLGLALLGVLALARWVRLVLGVGSAPSG